MWWAWAAMVALEWQRRPSRRRGPCIDSHCVPGIAAGAVAGLVGTWAMSEVQRLWTRVVDDDPPESAGGRHDARDWQERSEHQNSNELAAQAIAGYLLGRRLTQEELRLAAPLVHYLFGAAVGAIMAHTRNVGESRVLAPLLAQQSGSPRTKSRCPCSVCPTRQLVAPSRCICNRWSRTSYTALRQK